MTQKTREFPGARKEMIRRHAPLAGMMAVWLGVLFTVAAPHVSADREQSKPASVQAQTQVLKGLPATALSEDEAILHTLNRLGFGPRPGDVERVRKMGLKNWIERQLNPESIDDSALNARLEQFPTLKMSSARLLEEFPQPKQPAQQAGVSRQELQQRREERRKERESGAGDANPEMKKDAPPENPPNEENAGQQAQAAAGQQPAADSAGNPFGKNRPFGKGDPSNAQQNILNSKRPQRIVAELSMAKMTRAIYSERQLYEEMVDFWFNHFNVFFGKGADKWMLTSYERDTIRPHAMGKFKDLVVATAKSPAMLFYLDNWLSADPASYARMRQEMEMRRQRFNARFGGNDPFGMRRFPRAGQGQPAKQNQNQNRGLNENYGRELMELHTLGVDGGYTQEDVIEVAKCFTGWTLETPRRDPEFRFDERIHDPKTKTVLGKKINDGGMRDAEQVIDLLVRHPNTAKFISTKLARRFVADTPPPALVDRMAKTFLDSDGDIRAVLRTMIYSPEFWSRDSYRAKIKRPFELVASTARALGAEIETPLPLVMWVGRIGEPLYLCQPPTGYSDKAETWVNTGALLNRLNFSLAMANNRMRGSNVDPFSLLGQDAAGDSKVALNRSIEVFLAGQVSKQTREVLEKQLDNPEVLRASLDDPVKQIDVGVVAGLVLGSPEFQRR
jgi:uncharacterized protein (DUF1800 family)